MTIRTALDKHYGSLSVHHTGVTLKGDARGSHFLADYHDYAQSV